MHVFISRTLLAAVLLVVALSVHAEIEVDGPRDPVTQLGPVVLYFPDCDFGPRGFVGAMDRSYLSGACTLAGMEMMRAETTHPLRIIRFPGTAQGNIVDEAAEAALGATHRIIVSMPVIATNPNGIPYVEMWGRLYDIRGGDEKTLFVDRLMRSGSGNDMRDAGRSIAYGYVNGIHDPRCTTFQMRPLLKPWKKVWTTRCEGFNAMESRDVRDAGAPMRFTASPAPAGATAGEAH